MKNLIKTPTVRARIADRTFEGHARVVSDSAEDPLARQLLYDKYAAGYSGDLSEWRDTALPIAVDLSLGEDESRSG